MYYRDGQPIAGSQTKHDEAGQWFALMGWVGAGKRLEHVEGPFKTCLEADRCLSWFGMGVVAATGEELKHLEPVEHTGAPREGNPPAEQDSETGALKGGK